MKTVIKRITIAWLSAFLLMVGSILPLTSVHAATDLFDKACSGNTSSAVCASKDEGATREAAGNQVQDIINLLLYALGILAVIMIVLGGFRYVLSQGDAGAAKQGRDTVLYAAIGLVVAMLSYAIVNFFIFRLQPPQGQ